MIGRFLEHAGGGRALADWLLGKFGRERAVWAVLLAAFLVGLPIFFEVGFIILVPLVWNLARESKTVAALLRHGADGAAHHHACAGAAASGALGRLPVAGRGPGRVILYGAALSLPMAIVSGILYGGWISTRIFLPVPAMAVGRQPASRKAKNPPPVPLVVLILLLPVLLIFAATIWGGPVFGFLGHPFTALTITALAAMLCFGLGARARPQGDFQNGHRFAGAHRHAAGHHGRRRRLQAGDRGFRRRTLRRQTAGRIRHFAAAGGLSDGRP